MVMITVVVIMYRRVMMVSITVGQVVTLVTSVDTTQELPVKGAGRRFNRNFRTVKCRNVFIRFRGGGSYYQERNYC